MAQRFASVDEYVATHPPRVQEILEEVRAAVRRAAPDSGETISYHMPTVTLDGVNLLHYAAWKSHLGIYPVPLLDDDLEPELAPYRAAKDTVRFRYASPVPYHLVERLVAFLVRRRDEGAP